MFVLISELHRIVFTYTQLPFSPFRIEYFLQMSWLSYCILFTENRLIYDYHFTGLSIKRSHMKMWYDIGVTTYYLKLWAPHCDQFESCCLGEEMGETETRHWSKHPRSLFFLRIARPCALAVNWITGCVLKHSTAAGRPPRTLSTMAIMEDVTGNCQDGWVERCLSIGYFGAHLWGCFWWRLANR